MFQPEPLALWHDQIRRLRSVADLWDCIVAGKDADVHQARASLGRKITQAMAGVRFDVTLLPQGKHDQLVIRYQPRRLTDAIWQRFAEEVAGMIASARCPAPKCGRWFLRSAGREDRRYCCHACQMRAWRANDITR